MPTQKATTAYYLARSIRIQLFGSTLVLAGVLVVLMALVVRLLDLPQAVLGATMLLAAAAVFVVALLAVRRRPVLSLDDHGYRLAVLRSAGARQAAWREVEDLVTATLRGHDCVVLRLRDGRATTIPVRVLEADPQALVRDLSAHLDKGHGYRRLR